MSKTIESLVVENCTFPSDFTNADKSKFGNEVSAAAGRYLPKADIEELVSDVTASKKGMSVKFSAAKYKAEKGESMNYNFRLTVWIGIVHLRKLEALTGYAMKLDLTAHETFWQTWERAKVEQPSNA